MQARKEGMREYPGDLEHIVLWCLIGFVLGEFACLLLILFHVAAYQT